MRWCIDVVSSDCQVWVICFGCPGIKCNFNSARDVLEKFRQNNMSNENGNTSKFLLKSLNCYLDFSMTSSHSLVRSGISDSFVAGCWYFKSDWNGFTLTSWKD